MIEWLTTTPAPTCAARHFLACAKSRAKAVGTITGAIDNDPDTEVKKKAVFALSQLPREEGVPKLIEVAQNNRNREFRSKLCSGSANPTIRAPCNFSKKCSCSEALTQKIFELHARIRF